MSTPSVPTAPSHTASTVSVKPPPFMAVNPTAWFTVMEAQFHLANITITSTKFYHSLAALPPEVVGQLPASTLASQDYSVLKTKVCELHEATKPEILDRFLQDRPLTGKPSVYLAEMEHLATKAGLGNDLVRHRFQKALPPNIAPIIATQKSTPLDDLGKLADELCSFTDNIAINRASSFRPQTDQSHTNKYRTDLTPFAPDQRPKICRAHIYFADRARTCRSWCRWPNKSSCKITQSNRNTPHSSPSHSRDNSPSRLNQKGPL